MLILRVNQERRALQPQGHSRHREKSLPEDPWGQDSMLSWGVGLAQVSEGTGIS